MKAELAKREGADSRELALNDIRDAFRDEAGDLVEAEEVELVSTSPSVITSSAAVPGAGTEESAPTRERATA